MTGSVYGLGDLAAVLSPFIGGPILIIIATCYMGIKLFLNSKMPGDNKLVAVVDFCIAGMGILMFSSIFTTIPTFAFEFYIIHPLFGIGAIIVSWRMLKKINDFQHGHVMVNPCKCMHSMEAHSTNGSECNVCMCGNFQGNVRN